ncbi:MFS transporter [Streptacidiphilus jiangxiensis]|uniref:MFS-type transporter involved in bile tolerance, Atg22 family n=1 Tax=Streptacidiphilus jiangxiensis TaxID=235985 RepID=A0A1H7JQY9_STRJI|nr:MFS transporter [Streptacidiphilus jiangxiensis]SEK77118.1 MFS-type transporter involved in bile tolerance, Atg22 family [Streptacidiphilus jiangxiensis]
MRTERLLLGAAFATALGNNVQLISGALLMIRQQHTMLSVGWLFIAVALPQALLSPFFGRLADRFDRRRLWIACDLCSTGLALALPLWLAAGGSTAVGVYGANFALALVSALFLPVSAALVKERVDAARLRRFNGGFETATQSGMLLSATVGGLAVQRFGAPPLLVFNAATFAVSAVCAALLSRRRPAPATAPDAAVHVAATADPATGTVLSLRRVIVLYAQGSVVVTVFNALLPTFVLAELHRGAGTFGAIDALGSLGFLLAAAVYQKLARRHRDLRIALAGFLVCNVLMVLQGLFGVIGLVLLVPCGAFVFGQARIASRNLLMAAADTATVGRAFGRANAGGLAATIAAMLVVATVTDHSDARYGFATTALLGALATLSAALLHRGPQRTPALPAHPGTAVTVPPASEPA